MKNKDKKEKKNTPNRIAEMYRASNKLADSASTMSLIGAGTDEFARDSVRAGSGLAIGGAICMFFTSSVIPKITVAVGLGAMSYGFVRGFRKAYKQAEQQEKQFQDLNVKLSQLDINNITPFPSTDPLPNN